MKLPHYALVAIVLATIAGAILRVLAARGGLWLDEAWSAIFARDSATAIGALRIGHDNNHVLNSWWLQLAGWNAPSLVMRGLSIASGVLSIPVAAAIANRRTPIAAALAAWLFAVSPILVTYGSEARGYAPMILALLVAVLLLTRAMDRDGGGKSSVGITLVLTIGALAQMTILFALPALIGWVAWRCRRDRPLGTTAGLLGPGCAAVGAAVAATMANGMVLGSYQPFAVVPWLDGLTELARYTLAIFWIPGRWLLMLVAAGTLGLVVIFRRDHWAALLALAVLAFPIAVALLGIGNSGYPRYYLVAAVILLLGMAQMPRIPAVLLTMVVVAGSFSPNLDLIRLRRGDPSRIVEAMQDARPHGGTFAVEADRDVAIIEVAAAQAGYPAILVEGTCPASDFLFVARGDGAPFPSAPIRCGVRHKPIARAGSSGLSGHPWQLYARVDRR